MAIVWGHQYAVNNTEAAAFAVNAGVCLEDADNEDDAFATGIPQALQLVRACVWCVCVWCVCVRMGVCVHLCVGYVSVCVRICVLDMWVSVCIHVCVCVVCVCVCVCVCVREVM